MPTSLNKYLDPTALDETVLNIRELIEGLEAEMQDLPYARHDGIYPDMTVGAVIGADSTAQWATRESTSSGAATVRSVQGAAVVWNQLAKVVAGQRTSGSVTINVSADGTVTVFGTATSSVYLHLAGASYVPPIVQGHKYLVRGPEQGGNIAVHIPGGTGFNSAYDGQIITALADTGASSNIYILVMAGFDGTATFKVQLFDLTVLYGAGNEPATVAEFERMYPASYYPYSAPTLKPVQIAGIASTDAQGGELDSVEWETQTLRAAGGVADMLYSDHVETRVGVVTLTGNETINTYAYTTYTGFVVLRALPSPEMRAGYQSVDFGTATTGQVLPNTTQFAWIGVNDTTVYLQWADCPYATVEDFKAWLQQRYAAGNPVMFFYELATPTTTPISPALPMTYRVQAGGSESIIVPDGEVSAAPVLTVAEPVNAGDEFARIWAAIESLGYTRNTTQLSRPVSLTDIGSIDEVQKDTTDVVEKEAADVAEIDTVKEVQE